MRKTTLFIGLTMSTVITLNENMAYGQRIICDETCRSEFQKTADDVTLTTTLKSASTSNATHYAVVSPVGNGTVEMIRMAPRLQTLDGKTSLW